MPDYRRTRVPGGTFFFTVAIADGAQISLVQKLDLLRRAYAETLTNLPVRTEAIVVLPDHLHAVWTLPPGDADFSTRWRRLKGRFTRMVELDLPVGDSRRNKGERGIWQRRFWERRIRDKADLRHHVEYCWSDPVRHGVARCAADWQASSFHRDVRAGLVSGNWTPEAEHTI